MSVSEARNTGLVFHRFAPLEKYLLLYKIIVLKNKNQMLFENRFLKISSLKQF